MMRFWNNHQQVLKDKRLESQEEKYFANNSFFTLSTSF
jgi:hypothetical protein